MMHKSHRTGGNGDQGAWPGQVEQVPSPDRKLLYRCNVNRVHVQVDPIQDQVSEKSLWFQVAMVTRKQN